MAMMVVLEDSLWTLRQCIGGGTGGDSGGDIGNGGGGDGDGADVEVLVL